jgi:glycolate oxidase FAD binding subunit
MVGSQGRFGVLVELSCKVFPLPEAWATCAVELPDLNAAMETMERLGLSPLELTCLDLEPPSRLWLRVAGLPESLPTRIDRLRSAAKGAWTQFDEQDDYRIWRDASQFTWAPRGHGLVRIPLISRRIPTLEQALSALSVPVVRRYSVGGNVAWLAWPVELPARCLDQLLKAMGLSAVPLTGAWPDGLLGRRPGQPFAERLLRAFDPLGKFGPRP